MADTHEFWTSEEVSVCLRIPQSTVFNLAQAELVTPTPTAEIESWDRYKFLICGKKLIGFSIAEHTGPRIRVRIQGIGRCNWEDLCWVILEPILFQI